MAPTTFTGIARGDTRFTPEAVDGLIGAECKMLRSGAWDRQLGRVKVTAARIVEGTTDVLLTCEILTGFPERIISALHEYEDDHGKPNETPRISFGGLVRERLDNGDVAAMTLLEVSSAPPPSAVPSRSARQ